MVIKTIKITNFRSIHECGIDLDLFNIQVGQNNHGKTNYFEAIRWFFNGFLSKESLRDMVTQGSSGDVTVEITFSGLQDAIENMTNAAKKTAMQNIFSNNQDEIVIRRTTAVNDGKKRQLLKPDATWHDPMGVDKTWGDLLPKLEYVDTQTRASEINGYTKKSPITEMLSGILGAIIESDPNYRDFTQKFRELFGNDDSQIKVELDNLGEKIKVYLQKQFPDGNGVTFDIEAPVFEDLLKNFSTKIDDGVITNIEDKGDGMQRALMLSIIQAYADYRRDNNISRKFIFLIDEAELHLHPRAQRALKRALHEIAENGEQVLINTHSSVLISDNDETRIFKVMKSDGITDVQRVKESDKSYIIYDLLGGSPLDLLLPRNYLIVEGASESKFIRIIIERFYGAEFADIFVLAAEGDINRQSRSMAAINHVFLPIKPIYSGKTVILCDKPRSSQQQTDFEQFCNSYSLIADEDYFVLTESSLEAYYPEPWRKTEAEIEVMQQNRLKVSYAEEVARAITKNQFESDMPAVHDALMKSRDRAFN